MKKFIAVAAILSVMFLGAGTSLALMGVPDAVPGKDILIPFFMVSMPDEGSDNSLITITDVTGAGAATFDELHLRLYDSNSIEQYNEWISITADDVYVTDALTLVNNMSPLGRAALEIDLDDNGTPDHWVGYIHFESLIPGNNFMAHVYQVSVTDGVVAGYTGVSLEDATVRIDARLEGYQGAGVDFVDLEAFSANALNAAREILRVGILPVDATSFRLLPRIYLADADSTNILIIWTDVEPAVGIDDPPGDLHVNFYDQDENAISSPITIDKELNFIEVKGIYPDVLTGTAPYAAGWIDIETTAVDIAWDADRYWLGYSLQRAAMAGGTTLDVILEVHRDAN